MGSSMDVDYWYSILRDWNITPVIITQVPMDNLSGGKHQAWDSKVQAKHGKPGHIFTLWTCIATVAHEKLVRKRPGKGNQPMPHISMS